VYRARCRSLESTSTSCARESEEAEARASNAGAESGPSCFANPPSPDAHRPGSSSARGKRAGRAVTDPPAASVRGMLGLEPGSMVDAPIASIVHPDDKSLFDGFL
jgi:hypothetical protein